MKKVGFWRGKEQDTNDTRGFPRVENFIDPSWDADERNRVVVYLTKGSHRVRRMRGHSTCRVCGCRNGSAGVSDGTYTWPSGFRHYIEGHNVKPPQDFIDYVNGK